MAVMLLFFILITGMWAVDSSTNYLMSGKHSFEIINVENNPEHIEITLMNKKLYINTKYINRDITKLKQKILALMEK